MKKKNIQTNNRQLFPEITEESSSEIMYHSTKKSTTRRHIDNLQNELSQLEPDSTYIKDITNFISGKAYNQDKRTKM